MAAKLARERATEFLIHQLLPKVTFKQIIPPSLICLVCRKVLQDPLQLSCGHRVCKTCNDDGIPVNDDGTRNCPDDNDVIERVFPDRSALTDIMNLECCCVGKNEGCDWEGVLLDLEVHFRGCVLCVEQECPYKEFQCPFIGSKGKLAQHFKDDAHQHDCLLAMGLRECVGNLEDNRNRLMAITENTPIMQKSFEETKNELLSLTDRIRETSVLTDSEKRRMEQLQEKMKSFQESIDQVESKKNQILAISNQYSQLEKNAEEQMKTIDEATNPNSENRRQTAADTKKTVNEKVNRLTTENASHGKVMHELGIKIRIAQCTSNEGHYTWKLDNLDTRLREARTGKVKELYTPPLYTSKFGYKYSAKVMLAGDRHKDHIAVYIVLMQGDYDEILKFPFPYPIEITLRNLNRVTGENDIRHTLFPDPNKIHFSRPVKNMNPAIGFARFCSQARLRSDGFVKNDTIYFNIKVKKEGVNVQEPDV